MPSIAVTTAERPPAPTTALIDRVGVAVLVDGAPTAPVVRELPDGVRALEVSAPEGAAVEIRLATPLQDAVGYWYPDSRLAAVPAAGLGRATERRLGARLRDRLPVRDVGADAAHLRRRGRDGRDAPGLRRLGAAQAVRGAS